MKLITGMASLFLLIEPAFSQEIPLQNENLKPIQTELTTLVDKNTIPSFGISVISDGNVIWKEIYGFADTAKLRKAGFNTIYAIGSTSKSITATALDILSHQKNIDPKTNIEKLLPSLKIQTPFQQKINITLQDFVNMTAGVPHLWRYNYLRDGNRVSYNTKDLLRKYLIVNPALIGKMYYSNLSLSVPELVIEKYSRQSFDDYVKKELFDKLKMKNSFASYDPVIEKNRAINHTMKEKIVNQYYYIEPKGGASGYASLEDLEVYAKFHLGLFDKNLPNDLKRSSISGFKPLPSDGYRSGWGIIQTEDDIVYISNGSVIGGNAIILLQPQKKIAIVYVSSSMRAYGDDYAFKILDVLIPGYSSKLTPVIEKAIEKEKQIPFTSSPGNIGSYEGFIVTPENKIPMSLFINKDNSVDYKFGDSAVAKLVSPVLENQQLMGEVRGTIKTTDTNKQPHKIKLALSFGKDQVSGFAIATAITDKGYYQLPFLVELRKKQVRYR